MFQRFREMNEVMKNYWIIARYKEKHSLWFIFVDMFERVLKTLPYVLLG